MTTESKQRAANIKARREALGISFEGFYDQLGLSQRHGEFVENGQYGKLTSEHRDKAEKFLTHLEQKFAKKSPKPYVGDKQSTAVLKEVALGGQDLIVPSNITTRREALNLGIKQFAADIGVPSHDLALAEQGAQGGLMQKILVKADDRLKQLEREERIKPLDIGRIANFNGKWHWASTIVPAGTSMTFRILPNNGKEFTEEELAAFPALDLTPKPTPEYKAHRIMNDKKATQKQLERFADGMCLTMLKSEQDIVTIPWAQFYELLYIATGAGHFDQMLLDTIFSNSTCTGVPFLISYGNNVVVICRDANFAPIDFEPKVFDDKDLVDDVDEDIKQPTTW